jgi:pseudouridine synthase
MPHDVEVALRDIFARAGPWSRRELRRMQGGVRTDGGTRALAESVQLDGNWRAFHFRSVSVEARVTLPPLLLMDKPVGVLTSRAKEGGASTVFDLLDDPAAHRVEPVGRLDLDSSGLLLLTADGRLIQRLTHPKREIPRTYLATVAGTPDPEVVAALRAGTFALKDGHRPHPHQLDAVGEGVWLVTLVEGKYHEVRRMFAAAGAHVTALRRTRFAGFHLDDLSGRRFRRLEESEVEAVYAGLGLPLPPLELEVRERNRAPSEG